MESTMSWMLSVASLVILIGPTCVFSACNTTQPTDVSTNKDSISSPNFPKKYGNNTDSCWNLSAIDGVFTKITIHSFMLEFWHDYLKLDVGIPGDGYFILLTNPTYPIQLIGYSNSSNNDIQALFHTDPSKTNDGFNLTVSTVTAKDLNDSVKIGGQLMSSPLYLTSQGGGKSSKPIDLMVASFESDVDFDNAWQEAVELLGPSTRNGLNVSVDGSNFILSWTGLGDFEPVEIIIGNRAYPWETGKSSLKSRKLASGTTFNIQVIVKNKNGANATFYVQEKTENDKCGDSTCGTQASCVGGTCKCMEGYKGNPDVGCRAFCNVTKESGLIFNESYAGKTTNSNQKCNNSRSLGSMVCKATPGQRAKYDNLVRIESCNQTIENLISALSDHSSSENITTQAQQLQLMTSNIGQNVSKEEVGRIAEYLGEVSNLSRGNKVVVLDAFESNVNTINNLIRSRSIPLYHQDPKKNSDNDSHIELILTSINSLANSVSIPSKEISREIVTESMLVKVTSSKGLKDIEYAPVILEKSSGDNASNSIMLVKINVPSSALKRAKELGGNVARPRVSFFVHLKKNLFHAGNTANVTTIVAANLGKHEGRVDGFGPYQVQVTLPNSQRQYSKPKENRNKYGNSYFDRSTTRLYCVYWNESEWRRDGGHLVIGNSTDSEKCAFDHLTNFAVLMARQKLDPNIALEIWSIVGLSISIFGLALTIIVHLLKEDVRKRRPTVILFHICTCLIISHIVFMIGIGKIEERVRCTVIAALLQFFYLASWTWMAIYAFDMYRSLVLVFHAAGSKYFTKITMVGYGAPLLITALNSGVAVGYVDPRIKPDRVNASSDGLYNQWSTNPKANSSYVRENVCWIHEYSLYFGFLFPVAILITCNIFVYASVIKTIKQRGNTVKSTAKETSAKDYFFISVTLIASTGIPWAVGYLMLLSTDQGYLTAVGWIFAILNTLQGFIIFLCTCVRNEHMRNIWLTPLLAHCRAGEKSKMLLSNSKSYGVGAKNISSQEVSNAGSSTAGIQLTSTFSSTTPSDKGYNGNA